MLFVILAVGAGLQSAAFLLLWAALRAGARAEARSERAAALRPTATALRAA
jgi:hypothetical protein